jgi:hypothetical protein
MGDVKCDSIGCVKVSVSVGEELLEKYFLCNSDRVGFYFKLSRTH